MAAVELKAITKVVRHHARAVRHRPRRADGEFLTLVGPSGCGKSTLLRIIAGLETQVRQRAVGGGAIDHLRPHERRVAMVFQSYALYPHMTVAESRCP